MSLTNIDDKLAKLPSIEPQPAVIEQKTIENHDDKASVDTDTEVSEEKLTHLEQFRKDKEEFLSKEKESLQPEEQSSDLNDRNEDVKEKVQQETDEYGNEVPKAKVYTEEEVQAMIRKRLKLHHEEKAQQQQPHQQQAQQPTLDENESWEAQLENLIDNKIEKRERDKQEKEWKAQAERAQFEFETKFTNGMSKYKDFAEVVNGKPVTNGILMATRSMSDPAAFVYAASKNHSAELERISKITDPYVQAAEVGRLEERMRKAKNISKAPKPPTKTQSDIADRGQIKNNIDDLIRMDAKRKLVRR